MEFKTIGIMPSWIHVDALAKQNLAIFGLAAEPRGDVAYRADRGVARALGEADLP